MGDRIAVDLGVVALRVGGGELEGEVTDRHARGGDSSGEQRRPPTEIEMALRACAAPRRGWIDVALLYHLDLELFYARSSSMYYTVGPKCVL